jgi:hypothetical protein
MILFMGKKEDKKKDEKSGNLGFLSGVKMGAKDADSKPKSSLIFGSNPTSMGSSSAGSNLTALPQMQSSTPSPSVQSGKEMDKKIFTTGLGGQVIAHTQTWEEILADTANWRWFPFSHGCELELVLCDNQGKYIEGDNVVHLLDEMVKSATKIMTDIINNQRSDFPRMPDYIKSKLKKMPYNRTDLEKGFLMVLDYEINNQYLQKVVNVDSFGRDGNVTMSTFILELVTPPAQYAEELAYWAGTLFNLAKAVLPKDLHIMSTAINPAMKEYVRGLSHGDHHHLGSFASEQEKVQAYDMIRNFLPHIIALSVNSPIINNQPTDAIKTKEENGKPRFVAPNCIRSIRLLNNTTMLSNSNEPSKFLPYLLTGDDNDKQKLLQVLQKASLQDARFQDVYPFTKYGTMEIRVMDAQLSICRRIGLGLLVEAMCYKARKLLAQGKVVPDVNSETICVNRRSAIERGCIGVFKPVNLDYDQLAHQDPFFAECYLGPKANPHRFIFQSVQSMFVYLKEELIELGYLYSPFLKPVLQSVFGDVTYAAIPITEAEYQLSLYDYKIKQGQQPNVFSDLIYFTTVYSKDPIQNPLTGDLTLPPHIMK